MSLGIDRFWTLKSFAESLGSDMQEIQRKRMGTPSYLLRPQIALRNFGLPILLAGEGLGAKLAPPSVAGTKGTLLLQPFPRFFFAVTKFILAEYIWAPVEGL